MQKFVFLALVVAAAVVGYQYGFQEAQGGEGESVDEQAIVQLVENHARAWEEYDEELFLSTVHEDIVFAYPGRRLNYDELLEDYRFYHEAFEDTVIYIHNIAIDGDLVAVEWQFAATRVDNGKRTVVSDAIIGMIRDDKIVSWKEYLDGRVTRMQVVDALPLEEGEEPFPSPLGSLRNYCEVACVQ